MLPTIKEYFKTDDLRSRDYQPSRYNISSGLTINMITGGIMNNDDFNSPLLEELVIEKSSESTAILRYALSGNYAPFPKNVRVEQINDGKNKIMDKIVLSGENKNKSEIYPLCFTENYTIIYNDNIVLKLERERGWYIEVKTNEKDSPIKMYINHLFCDTELTLPRYFGDETPFRFKLQDNSIGLLSCKSMFTVKSTGTMDPIVMNNDGLCYSLLASTDDYYTESLTFKALRRWRIKRE